MLKEKIRLDDSSVYVHCGSLYSGSGNIIEEPSMLVDGDVLLAYGSYSDVALKFDRMLNAFKVAKFNSGGLNLIQFSKGMSGSGLPISDIAYIFRRAIEFTATGFVLEMQAHWGNEGFMSWLESEEEKIPLELERK